MALFYLLSALTIALLVLNTYACDLKSWSVHTGMKKKTTKQLAGYDAASDRILLIGGQNDTPGARGNIAGYFEFDVKSHQFTTHHDPSIISFASAQSYTTLNDTIYNYFGKYIQSFNMKTKFFNNQAFINLAKDIINPCVTTDGKQYIVLIGGVYSDTSSMSRTMYIYDIFQHTWLKQGPELNIGRSSSGCLVASDHFLYVFGGIVDYPDMKTTNKIERINFFNISTIYNSSWEMLSNIYLTKSNSQMGVIEINGLVYIIGGLSGYYYEAIVDIFQITSNNISKGASLQSPTTNFAMAGNKKCIYLFGGSIGHNASVSKWQMSNNLLNDNHNSNTFWTLIGKYKTLIIICVLTVLLLIGCIIGFIVKKKCKYNNYQDEGMLENDVQDGQRVYGQTDYIN